MPGTANPKGPDQAPDQKDRPAERARSLAEIYDVTLACLRRTPDAKTPVELTTLIVKDLSQHFVGRAVCIPTGLSGNVALRNQEIFSRIGPETYEQLAQAYGLTYYQVYRIVRDARELRVGMRKALRQ